MMISRGILLSAILSACSLIIASAMKASWTHNGAHHRCMGTSSFLRRTTANRLGNTITKDCHSKPSNSVRYRPAYATPILFAESDNNSVPFTAPTRCSSRDAASIIQNSTAHDGLLIITCDASGRGVRSWCLVSCNLLWWQTDLFLLHFILDIRFFYEHYLTYSC